MVLNPKIIKVNAAIDKTKEQIAELNSKLKDLEKQKTQFENDEIVAMFRREKLNEDEFAALLQTGRKKSTQAAQPPQSQQHQPSPAISNLQEITEVQQTQEIRKEVDADGIN